MQDQHRWGISTLGCPELSLPEAAALAERFGFRLLELRALSGKTHQVHTGVCIAKGDRTEHFVDSCKVTFFPLGEEEIAFYTATPEPYDKAGAYAIQGRAALWLDRIEGDYYTIMGLPVSRTVQTLAHFL